MQEKFFSLLADFNNKATDNCNFQKENSKEFKIFLEFLVIIKENLHYFEKEEYDEKNKKPENEK